MKEKRELDEVVLKMVEDLFTQPELKDVRTIGVVSDPNQGKTNLLNHLVDIFQRRAKETKLVSFKMPKREGVYDIHSIAELEMIHDSVVFMDEWADLIDLGNKRQAKEFEKTIRTIYHNNNIIILCGMARNFNGRVAGMMHAFIFKTTTLADVVQRSTIHNVLQQYNGGFQVKKGSAMLVMPKEVALIKVIGGRFDEVTIPYVKWGDTKLNNAPIVKWDK